MFFRLLFFSERKIVLFIFLYLKKKEKCVLKLAERYFSCEKKFFFIYKYQLSCRWSWFSVGQYADSWYSWIRKYRRVWGWRNECLRRNFDTPNLISTTLIKSAYGNKRLCPKLLLKMTTHRRLMHDIVKVVTILAIDKILVCNIGFIDLSIKTELSCFAYRFTGTLCHNNNNTRIVTYLEYPTNKIIILMILDVNFVLLFDTIMLFTVALKKFNDTHHIFIECESFLFLDTRHKIEIFLGLLLLTTTTTTSSSSLLSCKLLYAYTIMMMKLCLVPVSSCRWSWFFNNNK